MYQEWLFGYSGRVPKKIVVPVILSRGRDASGRAVGQPANLDLTLGADKPRRLPLVSCLMPTKDRFEQARFAISCFRRQTWPRKELIVLDQSFDERLAQWIKTLKDPTIRFVWRPGTREALGTLRNHSLDLAQGAFVCVWDDDDLQYPLRIEAAMLAMAATNAPASLFVRETIWMPAQRKLGILAPRPHENTLISAREIVGRYPSLPRGSDTALVDALLGKYPAVLLNVPELYVYVAHGINTWNSDHMEWMWAAATDRKEGNATGTTLALLSRSYPVMDYAAFIRERDAARSNAAG